MTRFEDFIKEILKNEGGYVNDKNDAGGETKYGISKRSYPNEDIKNLTKERAIEIYKKNFWIEALEDERVSPQLAFKIFDLRVNTGSLAIKKLQYVLHTHYQKDVKIDGVFGPKTEAALFSINDHKAFYGLYINIMQVAYDNISNLRNNKRFLKGWTTRLNKVYPKW